MKFKRILLIVLTIPMIGLIFSACIVLGETTAPDADDKLYLGIKYDNIELINEALEDGANIDNIKGISSSETNPVWIALIDGRKKIGEYLIQRGANANYANKSGKTLLMLMAGTDINFYKLLIEHGADVNKKNEEGNTALEYAVSGGNSEKEINDIVTLLIKHGAKITPATLNTLLDINDMHDKSNMYELVKRILTGLLNAGQKSGLNPVLEAAILGKSSKVAELVTAGEMKKEDEKQILFYTAAFGSLDTLKLLEAKGISLNTCDVRNSSLLYIASEYGQLDIVRYLLSKGFDLEAQNYDEYTALMGAVINDQYEVAKCLIEKGAKLTPYGFTFDKDLLAEASTNGNLKMIKLLLANGYPLDNNYLGRALTMASNENHFDVLKYFLENGANPNNESNMAIPPLENSSVMGNLEAVAFWIENGAKIDGVNVDGEPLRTASENGETEIVEYLIKQGANVNLVSDYGDGPKGDSALMSAITRGNYDIVKLLVDNGANLEYEDDYKNTAIYGAAGNGSRNILKYLIQKGADINHQNQDGQTELMHAASNGLIDNVKILLQYKADTKLKDKDGKTALDLAKKNKLNDIIKLLKAAK